MKRLSAVFFLLLFAASAAFSLDFGFLFDQKFEAENELLTYTPSVNPWFSWNGDNGMSVYLSAIFPLKFSKYSDEFENSNGWKFIPELSRFAFGYQNKQGFSLEAGRISYYDILGLTASGFFDGFSFKTVTHLGSIVAGAYYTGLLYKETAKVIMTDDDKENYQSWDWDNDNGYFASRRILASLRWDIPMGRASTFSFETLAQFDLNGRETTLNSQYFAFRFELFPVNMIKITAGALFESMQYGGGFNAAESAAFGALAQVAVNLPTVINDQLNFKFRSASGLLDDKFTPFAPINLNPQGAVFSGTMAGLTVIGLEYNARIIKPLYAECEFNYFMRTLDNSDGGFLHGGELYASFGWQPFEDMRVTLGGGAFFPQMGNIDSAGKTLWKITAGLALSL